MKIKYLTAVVKKTDYDTKIGEIERKVTDHDHDKYITTPEFRKLIAENFAAKLVQGNLITKTGFDIKLMSLKKKLNEIKQNICLLKIN